MKIHAILALINIAQNKTKNDDLVVVEQNFIITLHDIPPHPLSSLTGSPPTSPHIQPYDHLRSTSVPLFSSLSLGWFTTSAFNYGPQDVPAIRVHICTKLGYIGTSYEGIMHRCLFPSLSYFLEKLAKMPNFWSNLLSILLAPVWQICVTNIRGK